MVTQNERRALLRYARYTFPEIAGEEIPIIDPTEWIAGEIQREYRPLNSPGGHTVAFY